MKDIKQARLLLTMARKDLKALGVMLLPDGVDDEIFGFHLQQAAEKALKAWIAAMGIEYPLTHDLNILIELLENNNQNVEKYRDLDKYNPYAVQLRYEALDVKIQKLDRAHELKRVTDLVDFVEELIEEQ